MRCKFSTSIQFRRSGVNYLPYIIVCDPNSKINLKLLIDTGANKNIIEPGILQDPLQIKHMTVKNVNGTNQISRKGKLDIFTGTSKPLMFYELKFHDFFNGILGSETLANLKAKIDYKNETLQLSNKKINFLKYYPSKPNFNYQTLTLKTINDGDWFVPTFQKLHENTFIQPGLYRSENGKSTVKIITSNESQQSLPNYKLIINNFETISPIPIDIENYLDRDTIKDLLRTEHLSKIEKDELISCILKHQQVLLKNNEKLTATMAIKHKINTTNNEPVYTKSYRYPHHYKKDVEEQIKEMLENGIICNSTSPYSSPIWVVPKKPDASGKRKIRVVIDYRKLNEKTVNDKFPIPQIEEILDSLGKSVYFTTLDLKSGFHQIEMDPAHREKTAFSTTQGHFEFTRMPFGLKNAPATFQRAMNYILGDYIGHICYVYLDDVIIVGYNLKNHLENIEKVLKRLSDFNLKIQLDKCEFLKRETEFLGHIITSNGIKPDPTKISRILDWKLPTSQKEIKQFLGLTGYYRRFIRNYAKLAKPLTKFLKKDTIIDPNDKEYANAFDELKLILTSDQVLAYPDFESPFILTTDASNYALGAVLAQIQNNVEKPIAFGSRTLSKTEENYSTTEKEALAIMWAVEKYRPYLFGNKFILITDHKPLTFIKSSVKNSKILRWRLELENFDYEVRYKEGKTNVVADALSRKNNEINTNEINEEHLVSDTSTQENNHPMVNEDNNSETHTVHSADDSGDNFIHFTDKPINHFRNQIIFRFSNIGTVITETLFQNFNRTIIAQPNYDHTAILHYLKTFHNGKQSAILAPENLLQQIQETFREHFNQRGHFVFTSCMVEDVQNDERQNLIVIKEHDRAHRGINEVEQQLKRAYFFPNMHKLIKNYTNACKICNTHKYERRPYNIKISPRPITEKPLERVHMDIFIINHCSFLSLIDSFSKHLQMFYLKSKNIIHVQKAITKYISIFGVPATIITDHETTFRSIQIRNFLAQLGSNLEYASCSESNGQIERTHSTIVETFNTNKHKFQGMQTKSIIKVSVALYNNSVHSTTKFTPNEIMFNNNNNRHPEEILGNAQKIFLEAKHNMQRAQINQTRQNSIREEAPQLNENQQVFVIPNIRTKTQPRATQTAVHNITEKTFKNEMNTKRHKRKIKRLRKL